MDNDAAGASPVERDVMAPVPERTYTRTELLTALAAERHACSIVVWMTLMEALEPDADDKGLDGWMREAERRVKNRHFEYSAMELGRELYEGAVNQLLPQDLAPLRAMVEAAYAKAAQLRDSKTRSQRMREAGFTRRMLKRGDEGVVCTRSECQCEREGLGHQCIWLSHEKD